MINLIENFKSIKNRCLSNKQLNSYNGKKITKKELRKRVNTLENELVTLKNTIKDNLFHEFMAKLNDLEENKILKEENKKLRTKNKLLKSQLYYGEKCNIKPSKSDK